MTTGSAVRAALRNVPLPPGQMAGAAVVAMLGRLIPVMLPGTRAAQRAIGATLGGAGAAITLWAVWERARRTSGSFDLERPDTLVDTGPYALSRHPMYVGWWLIHLGAGVYGGSAWVLLTVPAAIVAEHPSVLAEERRLARSFGSAAENYAATVPRYVRLPARSATAIRPPAGRPATA